MMEKKSRQKTFAIVGLGYVGLPLAIEFAKKGIAVIGFDIDSQRVADLKKFRDFRREYNTQELKAVNIFYTNKDSELRRAEVIVVAVPTPVNAANQPDLTPLREASLLVGKNLAKNTLVVFESTVYPGVTEEICQPIIEKESGLKCGRDWQIGYSPERINPGDKEHTLVNTIKIVSGKDQKTLKRMVEIYSLICQAGLYKAPNIKTAEAAKVIENVQRDINIALMNELSLLFFRMGIETNSVLKAAGTKWNFLPFKPGLVGGHCIGVDPYYLTYKAGELGYHTQIISAGRRINDYMAEFVADLLITGLIEAEKNIQKAKVLVMGLTFKENLGDTRNSRIAVTINQLKKFGIKVYGIDPYLTKGRIQKEFHIPAVPCLTGQYDAIILATTHQQFLDQEKKILEMILPKKVFIDVKNIFPNLRKKPGLIYKSL